MKQLFSEWDNLIKKKKKIHWSERMYIFWNNKEEQLMNMSEVSK